MKCPFFVGVCHWTAFCVFFTSFAYTTRRDQDGRRSGLGAVWDGFVVYFLCRILIRFFSRVISGDFVGGAVGNRRNVKAKVQMNE